MYISYLLPCFHILVNCYVHCHILNWLILYITLDFLTMYWWINCHIRDFSIAHMCLSSNTITLLLVLHPHHVIGCPFIAKYIVFNDWKCLLGIHYRCNSGRLGWVEGQPKLNPRKKKKSRVRVGLDLNWNPMHLIWAQPRLGLARIGVRLAGFGLARGPKMSLLSKFVKNVKI